jgi:mono/diheme cytochrome c family protein
MNDALATRLARQLYRNLRILAILTVVFVVTLALAPFKWHNTEWRAIQKEYNARASRQGARVIPVGLKQIWRPEAGITDRCTSCHLGMGAAKPLEGGGQAFGRHPDVGHDVGKMGCTLCHRGQGRATTAEAAHGSVKHWESPMLPRAHLQAACGSCHGEAARIPPLTQVERGAYLFELHGCLACHKVNGRGGPVGPDLSGVALKGFDKNWHVRHLREPASVVEGSRMMSFGHLSDPEIDDILAYLETLIGAPDLIRGKAIAVEKGCRGCHRIDGIGGDVSVDLNEAASKPVTEYDFSNLEGPHTLETWHRHHLRDPGRVAPGSTMPATTLAPDREDALVTWILSLRRPEMALEQLPAETVLARMQARRDFAGDGESLFGVFCAACHGPQGRGKVMPSLGTTVPDLRNPDVHAILSRESLRYILEHGRPGRFMPAWGAAGAGLTAPELDALVAFLRRDLPEPPSWAQVRSAPADSSVGRDVFQNDCAACHGPDGSGTVLAPGLTNPEFLFSADDEYLATTITRGRAGTAMPAHFSYDARTVASLIAWLRERGVAEGGSSRARRKMEMTVRSVLGVRSLPEYRASGSPAYGEILYRSMCASCHGPEGRGLVGPAIASPAFLRAASDGLIAGTIVLGRGGRAMRSFGSHGLARLEGREVGDLIAFLRARGAESPEKPGFRTVQGTASKGREMFGSYCAGCHGEEGEGRTGPALRNPAFLDAVSDGFLQATLVRGRPGTAMRSWARGGFGLGELEPEEINDIVAYIRTWQEGI